MLVTVVYGFLLHSSPINFAPLHGWQASEAQKPQMKFMSSLFGLPKHSSISFLLVSHSTAKEEVKVWVRTLWILIHSFFLTLNFFHTLYRISPLFSSYFNISIYEDHIFSGIQKLTWFMYMFSCLLTLLFSLNLLHGVLTEKFHHLLPDLFFILSLFLWG